MADLFVKSEAKAALENSSVSVDFYDALDDAVETLLTDVARRAGLNDRKTVQLWDL